MQRTLWGCGSILGVLVLCGLIGTCINARKAEELAEADKLWEKGEKAEAVVKYKDAYSVAAGRKGEVLVRIVEFELARSDPQEAARWVETGYREKVEAPYTHRAALAMLAKLKKDDADKAARQQAEQEAKEQARKRDAELNRLLDQLASTDVDKQVAAARELGRYRDRKAIRALVHAFTAYNSRDVNLEGKVPEASSSALLQMGDEAVPELVETLNDRQVELRDRFSAATALDNLKRLPKSALPGLRTALKDPQTKMTAAGLIARAEPGDSEVLKYLIGAARGSEDKGEEFADAVTRAVALGNLGTMGPKAKDAIPTVKAALSHPNLKVREAAANALERIQK